MASLPRCGGDGGSVCSNAHRRWTENSMFRNKECATKLLQMLNVMRRNRQLCDVIIIAGASPEGVEADIPIAGERMELSAHRAVLAASSPYFCAMFTAQMAESKQHRIFVQEVNPRALSALLDYIYTSEIQITEDNVQALLPAANFLRICDVAGACCEFLKSRLHPSNCLGIRTFADIHACDDLLKSSSIFINLNFSDVVQSEEFQSLSPDQLIQVIQLFSSEVIKSISIFANEERVDAIIDTLCTNMISENEQLRDASLVGLKTVFSKLLPSSHPLTANACRRVTPRLVAAIHHGRSTAANTTNPSNLQQNVDVDVAIQLKGLDILADLLLRYGGFLSQFHATIEEALTAMLASSRLAVRKRAIVALAHLVAVCRQNLFNTVCEYLLDALDKNQTLSITRTYVGCIGAVSRAAGPRFGAFLPKFIPIMVKYCEKIDDDELREGCLQSFKSILLRCLKVSTPYVMEIISLCSKYLCHDPNYNYDKDESGDDMETDNVENGEMDTDQTGADGQSDDKGQEYSDDADMLWKVRRASAKCLQAILSTRREMLADFYRGPGPLLISRFKECEENVKADIFKAYIALLKHTKLVVPSGDPEHDETGLLNLLKAQLPQLIKAITKQLKQKSLKTRQSCFTLLTELLRVYPGCLSADYFGSLLPGVQHALTDKQANSNMKIGTLVFVGAALASHPAKTFQRYVPQLVPLVTGAVDDTFYKVTVEALSIGQQLIRVLCPPDTTSSRFDFTPHVAKLYSAVFSKLKATDIDQEVKERAITCTWYLLASFGDYFQEIISSESTMVEIESSAIFKSHIDQIWMVLLSHAGYHEEGVRNVVAECLGRLCLLEPERLLPTLKGHLIENDNPLVRATGITAVKFTIVDQPQPVDALLKTCIGEFLQTLLDPDLNVRHVALVTLNSAAHNKPSLVKGDILASVLPHVYAETKVRWELLRKVKIGRLRGLADDGLDLRIAAFECMYTLLGTCLERLDIFEFLSHVEDGLKDYYDIKMLMYLMVIRLAAVCPTQTLQYLDRWADPLRQTCMQKVKANSVKQEYEKLKELKRSALRAICALQMIPDADKSPQLQELTSMIRTTPELALLYECPISGHQGFSYEGFGDV